MIAERAVQIATLVAAHPVRAKTAEALAIVGAITWWSLWFTPDQQGQRLMNRGEFLAAAEAFREGEQLQAGKEIKMIEQSGQRERYQDQADNDQGFTLVLGWRHGLFL